MLVRGPKAAASEAEGVGLPGELVRAQHTVVLLPDLRHIAYDSLTLRPRPVMLRTQAVGMKSMQAAVRPADLALVRFNC